MTVDPKFKFPAPEKVTLPPVASNSPLASNVPVEIVKVPSISVVLEASDTVTVFDPTLKVPELTVRSLFTVIVPPAACVFPELITKLK